MKKTPVIFCVLALTATAGCSFTSLKTKEESTPKNFVFKNLDEEFVPLKETITESPFSDIEDFGFLSSASSEATLYKDTSTTIDIEYDEYILNIFAGDSKSSIYAEALRDIQVVDLVKNDDFYELAVYSEGASSDPSVSFLRYDGEDLYPLVYQDPDYPEYEEPGIYGNLHADETDIYPTYGAIWTNKKGTLITSFQNIGFTKDRIALSCLELEDERWVEYEYELEDDDVLTTYEIAENFTGLFTPMDEAPDDFDNSDFIFAPFDSPTEFKKGDNLEILDFGNLYNYYSFYIDYNGEKGVLAFFLGD